MGKKYWLDDKDKAFVGAAREILSAIEVGAQKPSYEWADAPIGQRRFIGRASLHRVDGIEIDIELSMKIPQSVTHPPDTVSWRDYAEERIGRLENTVEVYRERLKNFRDDGPTEQLLISTHRDRKRMAEALRQAIDRAEKAERERDDAMSRLGLKIEKEAGGE